jgi:Ca-activated chloride channel family protein
MSFDSNDPRWTAYVLGELSPSERAEVDALVAKDEAAARLVAELRETVGLLERELGQEPTGTLTEAQRAAVKAGPAPAKAEAKLGRVPRWRWGVYGGAGVALAAAALVAVNLDPVARKVTPELTAPAGKPEGRAAAPPASAPMPAQAGSKPEEPGMDRVAQEKSEPPAGGRGREIQAQPTLPVAASGTAVRADEPATAAPTARATYKGDLGLNDTRSGSGGLGAAVPAADEVGRFAWGGEADVKRPHSPPPLPDDRWRGRVDGEPPQANREGYDPIEDNPFLKATESPLSTFSIDVDTASYSNLRRILREGRRPPRGAVRIEELVNYFSYAYENPVGDRPFAADIEVATCPWKPEHRLVRIGLQGRKVDTESRPAANLVFLIDVSGSMQPANRLPLLKEGLSMLVRELRTDDRVAIVVYAGSSGLVLPSTPGSRREAILEALDRLGAGGSTNGGAGIQLAYQVARENFIEGGANRVLLATDGDFNVGISDRSSLVGLIQEKAKTGVFLTVLGFGTGNYQDAQLEALADKGNGNYAYIDDAREARKVLVEQASGTLLTIAKDVKIQVEFNPSKVAAYRLIGYENRILAAQDFNDDKKDAGEIGAGHTVTALYEVVPVGVAIATPAVDALKYQIFPPVAAPGADSSDLLTLKLRYKEPSGSESTKVEIPVVDAGAKLHQTSRDFRFAAAVAAFGMLLRDSPHKGGATWELVEEMATEARGDDHDGRRAELLELVRSAKALWR